MLQSSINQLISITIRIFAFDMMVSGNLDDSNPFDLRHLRGIVYDYTSMGIRLVGNNLTITINTIRAKQRLKTEYV